ncbi:hypothetical protein niasHT_015239 [Heterodera trifolii]|uniref:DUF659 domain-containing protein n=1 Tax=Heterodera trifolii TaxID=157864 RepID=A0ABD2L2L1_9BILA
MNRRWICSDVWMDILPSFNHAQLGLKMALLSDRFDVLVDAHFDGKSELTIWRMTRIEKDEGPKPKISILIDDNDNFVDFPLSVRQLPNKICFKNLQIWIGGTDFYSTTGKIIYCQLCEQQIPCTQFAHLKQHNETVKHRAKLERNKGGQQQQFLTTLNNVPNQFNLDLCEAFVSANNPFQKLENEKLKLFLEKYCKREMPHRYTLQKNYLRLTFDQTIEKIKNNIGDSFVWISVDETTDKMGRAVANLLIGKLDGQKWHNPHLISVKCLEKVDNAAIARFVNEGLDNFFSNGFDKNRVLLLVTDAAAYMKKAGKQLKVFYTNLIHTMCLCHALHRVAEKVRDEFKKADKLIAKTKAVFVKAPQRSNIYHQMFPDLAMPPKAVLTRWGTWLQAVSFYWQNFEAVKEVVNSFDPSDASCVSESQSCFTLSTWQDLAYIHTNFGNLCPAIAKLESQGLSINESMEIFADVHNQLDKAAGEKAEIIRQKISYIVSKNPSFDQIAKFCQILSGKNVDCDVPPTLIPYIDHSVITFLRSKKRFFDRRGTNFELSVSSSQDNDDQPVWDVFVTEILPIFATNVRQLYFLDGDHLDNLCRRTSPTILSDLDQLHSIDSFALFPDGIANFDFDGPNATAGQALAKWLHTPSKNGQPKRLYRDDYVGPLNLEWVNNFKETFRRATTSVSYTIQHYFLVDTMPIEQFELVNGRTKEKLTLKMSKEYDLVNWLLQRCPIGETVPIKWKTRQNLDANLNIIQFIFWGGGSNCIGPLSSPAEEEKEKADQSNGN